MPTPPYPLHPKPMQKNWLDQHPRWKIPLGFVTLIFLMAVFVAVLLTIVTMSLHRSDVYKQAMAKTTEDLQVREQIGEPVQSAWIISGQLQVNGSSGDANLSIPISGPRGKGLIRAVAHKTGGVWRFRYLQVSVEGQPGNIDLLSVQPPPERDF
jgi:hypothetical protein